MELSDTGDSDENHGEADNDEDLTLEEKNDEWCYPERAADGRLRISLLFFARNSAE
jgi:hypothetical protein